LKFTTKQTFIIFLALFIGVSCSGKKNIKQNKKDKKNDKVEELSFETSDPMIQDFIGNAESTENETNSLIARVKYLEELLNSYQAQSMALENPTLFFNKKILLTNGSMLYGNITYQDDLIVQLETLIGTLAIEKNTIMRVVDQSATLIDKDDSIIELNAQNEIDEQVDGMTNQHSAEVILLGDFQETKDENQNTVLSGQVKNIGSKRADFAKITFTIYRNQSYDSMPVDYTSFINGSSVSFEANAMSTSSLYNDEIGDFSLIIPSDFGPFVSYTYRIDWEEYE
tara:strand:- start:563 stop:1411 length:849 start_codon:yes stop_codon:yes gene_type:complete